jgi:hypothetical protein
MTLPHIHPGYLVPPPGQGSRQCKDLPAPRSPGDDGILGDVLGAMFVVNLSIAHPGGSSKIVPREEHGFYPSSCRFPSVS